MAIDEHDGNLDLEGEGRWIRSLNHKSTLQFNRR